MKSIQFPEMFKYQKTNIVSDYDATLQNLKMLIWSEKGELFGDPNYGTGLQRYLFDQNDSILADILIDDIYTVIANFMPQLIVTRKDITLVSDRTKVILSIKATNRLDFKTNLYNLVLLDTAA